jgi:hypothetical protein
VCVCERERVCVCSENGADAGDGGGVGCEQEEGIRENAGCSIPVQYLNACPYSGSLRAQPQCSSSFIGRLNTTSAKIHRPGQQYITLS